MWTGPVLMMIGGAITGFGVAWKFAQIGWLT
jgi:hypothetical protein